MPGTEGKNVTVQNPYGRWRIGVIINMHRVPHSLMTIIWLGSVTCSAMAGQTHHRFRRCEVACPIRQMEYADLDGDGLKDLLAIGEDQLLVFFQDLRKGFSSTPQVEHHLGDKPSVLWPAQMGARTGNSLLVATEKGISVLTWLARTAAPTREIVVKRETIVPDIAKGSALFFPLAMESSGDFPLILVPTDGALEIWRHENNGGWRHDSTLADKLQCIVNAPFQQTFYMKLRFLNLTVGDTNSDGREDLVVRQVLADRNRLAFDIYQQAQDGSLPGRPVERIEVGCNEQEWVCLEDVNRDGTVDIIRNTWLQEPWFIPGVRSGKVLVRVLLADGKGVLPEEPSHVFRKHDWQARIPIVDIDGDGYTDLVLGHCRWQGRNELIRAYESQAIDFQLRVHVFDERSGFGVEPTFTTNIPVFSRIAGQTLDFSWRDLFIKAVVLEGDFNGDGCRDLLFREESERLSVRFFESRRTGFSRRADLSFNIKLDTDYKVIIRDLNNDNVSDLAVVATDKDSLTVFLSGGD
ncbi:MAG: FG-GAP repeat domain-containing protein [Planctomycetota bacterium]